MLSLRQNFKVCTLSLRPYYSQIALNVNTCLWKPPSHSNIHTSCLQGSHLSPSYQRHSPILVLHEEDVFLLCQLKFRIIFSLQLLSSLPPLIPLIISITSFSTLDYYCHMIFFSVRRKHFYFKKILFQIILKDTLFINWEQSIF